MRCTMNQVSRDDACSLLLKSWRGICDKELRIRQKFIPWLYAQKNVPKKHLVQRDSKSIKCEWYPAVRLVVRLWKGDGLSRSWSSCTPLYRAYLLFLYFLAVLALCRLAYSGKANDARRIILISSLNASLPAIAFVWIDGYYRLNGFGTYFIID